MAGVSRLQYSSEIRLVRVMCSGRVDPKFILRAFSNGNDGVFIGGCRLNECNYVTQGNYDALAVTHICKKLLSRLGFNPERLKIAFMSGGDGNILADEIDRHTARVRALGPMGLAEGMTAEMAALKLRAAEKLAPFLRLVERERLRAPERSKAAYEAYYASDAVERLFDEVVTEKLVTSLIVSLLAEGPLSTGDIAQRLGLVPSEVSKRMGTSSRHGWVKYDVDSKRYMLA